MSRRNWVLVAALIAPIVLRSLWFYQGAYARGLPVSTPDYASFRQATPPLGSPVSTASDPSPTYGLVLLDWAHQNQFAVPELGSLASALANRGARVEVASLSYDFSALPLEERLKYADAYLVAAPTLEFTPAEVRAVARFVERGGRLVVISDPTRGSTAFDPFGFYLGPSFGDVAVANGLLAPHGLVFSDDYLYNVHRNEGNFRNVFLESATEDPITAGVDSAAFYGARSITSLRGTVLLVGDDYTFSSKTDRGGELAAAATDPSGNVLALGDLTFLMPPYDEVASNARLVENVAGFLAGGGRLRNMEDFPYLFARPIAIVPTDDFPLTADHLRSLAAAQIVLGSLGQDVSLALSGAGATDQVVFALFDNPDAIRPYLDGIPLVLPSESQDGKLTIPGLPPFDPTGVGVLLVSHNAGGTTLIVLAQNSADLEATFNLVTNRDLSGCFVHGAAAICQVGAGGISGFTFNDTGLTDFGGDLFLPTPSP
ncbi:MAG: DUF4350 domain-containing protein [Anaerolineales bacterium]